MSISAEVLVSILADGRFHTGDELGHYFGVSKTIIWREINCLSELGLDVHCVRGKGYRLSTPLTLLDAGTIQAELSPHGCSLLQGLEILHTVDSTNSHAIRLLQENSLRLKTGCSWICLSERQTAGKGRRGRNWISPFGNNIYLTVVKSFSRGVGSLDGLSLVAGLALVETLSETGIVGLGLKWPNDVMCLNMKLAGILVEITGDVLGNFQVVIGMGVNVMVSPAVMEEVEQPWTALTRHGFEPSQRNRLTGMLISRLLETLDQFEQDGFTPFRGRWEQFDINRGKELELLNASDVIRGRCMGIDGKGALVLQTESGIKSFHGGEVSLREAGQV